MHRRAAEDARKAIHSKETMQAVAETFKMLGDETRLKICLVLSRRELCVSDVAGLVGLSDSAVSHQLRIMKAMRLVTYRKEGKMTFYMLDDDHIEDLIRLGVRHVSE
ncbi:MAG TPA: metalloregulator ArsR/SmtB family transcription factor [Bacteroidota bacterium]|nr:metalloregulator ArsR/SmtB family transcription factor [Bacteroidota bacterium]